MGKNHEDVLCFIAVISTILFFKFLEIHIPVGFNLQDGDLEIDFLNNNSEITQESQMTLELERIKPRLVKEDLETITEETEIEVDEANEFESLGLENLLENDLEAKPLIFSIDKDFSLCYILKTTLEPKKDPSFKTDMPENNIASRLQILSQKELKNSNTKKQLQINQNPRAQKQSLNGEYKNPLQKKI